MCAKLNHRKWMKAEPSRLIPRKHTENLELLIMFFGLRCFQRLSIRT